MKSYAESTWHWPTWDLFRYTLIVTLAVGAWFALVFAGADWITRQHALRVRVHFDAELLIPFVPASVFGYMSIYPLFAFPSFILRTRREVRALGVTMFAVIAIGGIGFLLVPAQIAFPPASESTPRDCLVRIAKRVALENNLVPSLHIALSAVCICIYARRASLFGRLAWWAWSIVIAASTMLLHQHYLVDVITGYALGLAGVRLVYDRCSAE